MRKYFEQNDNRNMNIPNINLVKVQYNLEENYITKYLY